MQPTLVVVDNFFSDPDAVRRRALAGPFVRSTSEAGFTGSWNNAKGFEIQPTLDGVAHALGQDVAYDPAMPFSFRTLTEAQEARKRTRIHYDRTVWTAFVCLNPRTGPSTATTFYQHRATGLFGLHDATAARRVARRLGWDRLGAILARDSLTPGRWIEVGRIRYAYNRLIVMRARQFHAAAPGFGTRPANAKLTLLVPFEVGVDPREASRRGCTWGRSRRAGARDESRPREP